LRTYIGILLSNSCVLFVVSWPFTATRGFLSG
jgi:hypothetical protein